MAVAFEGQDMRRDPVEEPAVVADDDGAAGEIVERLFQRAKRVDVEIVCRFVKQQQVGAALQHPRQMDPVALATRQLADAFLLVAALEIELPDIGPRRHRALAELDLVQPVRDHLPDGLRIVEIVTRLVDIAELDRIADGEGAVVGGFAAGDHPEQRRLAGAVRADDADDSAWRKPEGQIVDQQPLAESLAQPLGVDDDVAEPRAGRNMDLRGIDLALAFIGEHLLIGVDPRLRLGLAGLRRGTHPVELARQRLHAGVLGLALLLQPLLLLLQPAGIIALVGDAGAAVEFEDPARHLVEEIAVVRDRDDGSREVMQEPLQPGHGFGVEMVRRLVEKKHVRRAQQQLAQRDPALLAAGQVGDIGIARRHAKRVHGDLGLALEVPAVDGVDLFLKLGLLGDDLVHLVIGQLFGKPCADLVEPVHELLRLAKAGQDVAGDIHAGVELRLLRKITDLDAVGRPGLAVELGIEPGHDLQQCRLARAVQAENADLRAGKEGQADVLQHFLAAWPGLGQAMHDIDILMAGHDGSPGCIGGRAAWRLMA